MHPPWLIFTLLHVAVGSNCKLYGTYESSEDASLWVGGIAFQSSGLHRSTTQLGLLYAVNLTGDEPTLENLQLQGVPDGMGFRYHGLHVDNASQRLYVVSHSDTLEEESIVVFDIAPDSMGGMPAMKFRYALVSPDLMYFSEDVLWYLNDVAAIDGLNELYTTQFGPQPEVQGSAVDKHLWRCTWDEADVRADGRLPASCAWAYAEASGGLNGITIDRDASRLWVNDLYTPALWIFDRKSDGSLVKVDEMPLPGVIDNVERDFGSGNFTMGYISDSWTGGAPPDGVMKLGGVIEADCEDKRTDAYSSPYVPLLIPPLHGFDGYGVSTSLVWGRWTLLGSPTNTTIICDTSAELGSAVLV